MKRIIIRYKLLAVVTLLLVCGLVVLGATNKTKSEAETMNQKYFKCITIEDDSTLWSIAQENITDEYNSINDYIDEVKSINNLTSDKIIKGATLIIPYYDAPTKH